MLNEDNTVQLLANLQKHISTVNCVRFSPNGNFLATGSDDGFVMIWKFDAENKVPNKSLNSDFDDGVGFISNFFFHFFINFEGA